VSTGLNVLRRDCTVDPDLTLRDIIRAVDRDRELVHFLSAWCNCDINAFNSEACCQPGDDCDFDHIEIVKHFRWDDESAEQDVRVYGAGGPVGINTDFDCLSLRNTQY